MTWGAVAVGVGSAVAGIAGSRSAAKKQESANKRAIALQREMWNTSRNDLAPYRDAGTPAVNQLLELVTNPEAQADYVHTNPFYRAQMQQAQDAVFANQAARGMLGSGATASALQQQYLAQGDQFLNNQYNRLLGLAGMGQSAAAGTASINQQVGNQIAGLEQNIGNVQAAGRIGQTNQLQNLLGQGSSFLGHYMAHRPRGGANNTPVSIETSDWSRVW